MACLVIYSAFLDSVSHFREYAYQPYLSAFLFCNINTSCGQPQIENCCIHLQLTFHLVWSNIYSLYKYWTSVRERCEDAGWCVNHSQNVFLGAEWKYRTNNIPQFDFKPGGVDIMQMPLTNGSTCNLLIKNIMGLKTMPGMCAAFYNLVQ